MAKMSVKVVHLNILVQITLYNQLCGLRSHLTLYHTKRVCLTCTEVCQFPVQVQWFSISTYASFVNKTDCFDMTEILLNVVINPDNKPNKDFQFCFLLKLYINFYNFL